MKAMMLVLVLAVLAGTSGCAGSPAPELYTLAALPGDRIATRPLSLELRRVGLAGYLDRPEIVRGTVQYHLRVTDNDHWGEPLDGMLERVVTEDLVTRLPNASVFGESGAITTRPDQVLEIDIQRLDGDAEGTLVLLAQVAVRPESGTATAQTVRLTANLPVPTTTEAQVAAMSTLIGQLADTVARLVAQRGH